MFCKNCGSELRDDAKFCTNCGKEVSNADNYSEAAAKSNIAIDVNKNDLKEKIAKKISMTVLVVFIVFIIVSELLGRFVLPFLIPTEIYLSLPNYMWWVVEAVLAIIASYISYKKAYKYISNADFE